LGLLQGWLDIGAMVILSLLCFIWAGRTLLGFCLLTCTFISLFSSGSGLDTATIPALQQALPVSGKHLDTVLQQTNNQKFGKATQLVGATQMKPTERKCYLK
jgi:hypothetical protein